MVQYNFEQVYPRLLQDYSRSGLTNGKYGNSLGGLIQKQKFGAKWSRRAASAISFQRSVVGMGDVEHVEHTIDGPMAVYTDWQPG